MFTLTKHSPFGTHSIRTNWDYVLIMLTENPFAQLIVYPDSAHIFYDKTWRDAHIETRQA